MKFYLIALTLLIVTTFNLTYAGKKFITDNPIIKALLSNQCQTHRSSQYNGFSPHNSDYRAHKKYKHIKPVFWGRTGYDLEHDVWMGESYRSGIHAWMIYWPHTLIGRYLLDQIGVVDSNFSQSNFESLRNNFSACWQKNSSKFSINGENASHGVHKPKRVFNSGKKHILLIDMDKKEISLHSSNGKSTPAYKIPYDAVQPALRLEVTTTDAKIQYLGGPEEKPTSLERLCMATINTNKKLIKNKKRLPPPVKEKLLNQNKYLFGGK
jgi:hypothetical protein